MVKASSPENGIVLDPFAGTGTTAIACLLNKRHYITYELNSNYYELILNRIKRETNFFLEPSLSSPVNADSKKPKDNQPPLLFGFNS